jgi:hypothetical protein
MGCKAVVKLNIAATSASCDVQKNGTWTLPWTLFKNDPLRRRVAAIGDSLLRGAATRREIMLVKTQRSQLKCG